MRSTSSVARPFARARREERRLLRTLLYERIEAETVVMEEELRAKFEASQGRFLTSRIHLRRLVVDDEPAAREAKRRVEAGEEFTEIAAQESTDPTIRATRGDVGELERSQVPVSLRGVGFGLETEGEVSEPFELEGKWNLLQLVSRHSGVPRPFEQVRAQLERELRRAKAGEAFERVLLARRAALGVKIDEELLAGLGVSDATSRTRRLSRPASVVRPEGEGVRGGH